MKKKEKEPELKMVRLIKLSDDHFNGVHPNGIDAGHVAMGFISKGPVVGERFYIGFEFSTSVVQKIINEDTFKTLYSTYRIIYLPNVPEPRKTKKKNFDAEKFGS